MPAEIAEPRRSASAAPPAGRRRRDRHGRGLRGGLYPVELPGHRSRAERFDDLALAAVDRICARWEAELRGTEFGVEDVPPSDPAPWEFAAVPLARYFDAQLGMPPRIVLYRRPIEMRAQGEDLVELILDVLVEQVAHALSKSPEEIDPGYGLA